MKFLQPNWPAPAHVKAFSSTRLGGVSNAPYQGLNLGLHVGDDSHLVLQNRDILCQSLAMPNSPAWLNQIHSTEVVSLTRSSAFHSSSAIDGDASFTSQSGVVCAVMTADCLPILLTDMDGSQVAAVHAGWRGLADGIVENALQLFAEPNNVLAWLGPAIGVGAFEVGQDVFDAFCQQDAQAKVAFAPKHTGKWLADMNQLATLRLNQLGVTQVFTSGHCTYSEAELFYSYRRDGVTGRQASFIWLE